MANLLSTAEERVYFKDLESRFLFVSAGWLAAYAPGRTADQLIGKTDFDVFSHQHAADAFADEQQIIHTGKPIAGQVERETYTGRPDAWVSTTKMPLLDEDGQIIGTFGISRDVTAQVSAENMLARQAAELSAQNERLRELDRLKDEFIAAVSHELRTPLTSIIGYIELLEEEGVDGPNTGRFAEVIGRNAEQLLRLVGDLLFLSRMRSGSLALELQGTDLAEIAAEAVAEARPDAQLKHLDLVLSAAAVPQFAADPGRITQLLDSLLSNAVKFTGDGGTSDGQHRRGGRPGRTHGHRHRHRHRRRRAGADIRALLPDRGRHPAGGPRDRPRAGHRQRHRGGAQRQHHRGQHRRPGKHVHGPPATAAGARE